MRKILTTGLKLALVAALLYWLAAAGKLDFHELRRFVDEPAIFFGSLALWALGSVVLGTFRWYLLMRGLGLKMGFGRAMKLQVIGFFFNTAIPGAVGGDIVKAVYVVREQHTQAKTPAMLSVLLDRVVGLAALFVMAGLAAAMNIGFFAAKPALLSLVAFVGAGLLAMLLGFAVIMMPFAPGKDPFERLLDRPWPGFPMLLRIYQAMRTFRERPLILLATLALSVVVQSGAAAYALLLTHRLTGQMPEVGVFYLIFAVGVMATALPLAPGGLGVGHVAFDRLFALIGLQHGANVFNLMALSQLAFNLLGFVPYLLYRTKMPALADMQAELEQVV